MHNTEVVVLAWPFPVTQISIGRAALGGMERFWQAGPESLILEAAALAILVAVAGYVITKIRPKPAQKEHGTNELLSKFRELHSQGGLSDAEFREIKTTLAAKLQQESKKNDENG
jgi:hypothetical protein